MNVEEIRHAVAAIAAVSYDDERAHVMEDELHGAVLVAIASGAADAPLLAHEALMTRKLDFKRWVA